MSPLLALYFAAMGTVSGSVEASPNDATMGINQMNISSELSLVPWPHELHRQSGALALAKVSIAFPGPSCESIANVLADEIHDKTGIRPTLSKSVSAATIILKLVDGIGSEGYRLEVNRRVTITASTMKGLSWGAVTLLQAIEAKNDRIVIPKMAIADHPSRPYRGLMVDVARRWHSIDVLKQCVILCHLNKLNYLQLHLSDDQSFTFPSKAFPLINTQNQHGGTSYTVEELKDLVRFGDQRGVTIVPEMDIPGHSATLNRTMPDLFKIKGTKPYEHHATINFVNPAVLNAVDTLIGEMCDVFKSSPYFHMGGDEADIALVDQHADFQAAFRQLGLPPKSQQELFRRFISQVNDMVKKHGKKLIVWEGFGRNPDSRFHIPKDILVMEFENAYYLPADLLADGYTVVNASWTPLYVVNRHVWPAKKVYDWGLGQFGRFSNLYPTTEWMKTADVTHIEGAQVCSWESPEEVELENLRRLVPAMAERVWNPGLGSTFEAFQARLLKTDQILEKLVHTVSIESSRLDAIDPNGYDVPCFTKPVSISLTASREGIIRYTLNGMSPTTLSTAFAGQISLTHSTTVRTALFSPFGNKIGYEGSKVFYYIPPHIPNLAVGKKVTVSGGTQGGQVPELAVDDNLDLASSWWAGPAPQWLQVDLAKTYSVNRIEVFPYWGGSRYYQYTVEVSIDGTAWTKVADRSQNTTPSSEQGDEVKFDSRPVRFVRVNMVKGSANDSVHLVELKVWEAK